MMRSPPASLAMYRRLPCTAMPRTFGCCTADGFFFGKFGSGTMAVTKRRSVGSNTSTMSTPCVIPPVGVAALHDDRRRAFHDRIGDPHVVDDGMFGISHVDCREARPGEIVVVEEVAERDIQAIFTERNVHHVQRCRVLRGDGGDGLRRGGRPGALENAHATSFRAPHRGLPADGDPAQSLAAARPRVSSSQRSRMQSALRRLPRRRRECDAHECAEDAAAQCAHRTDLHVTPLCVSDVPPPRQFPRRALHGDALQGGGWAAFTRWCGRIPPAGH